tara:strand:- start:5823 stop:6089 length:267 start_codon:yes stop_codon:yes gene_type:complete
MGIFANLIRESAKDIGYKIGFFGPMLATYIIGMELIEKLSLKYNISKLPYQILWSFIQYFWFFTWFAFVFKTDHRIRKYRRMIKSRKC